MSVHWGGKGPGHVSRWPRGVGAMSPYSGATMLLDFLNPVLDTRITFSRGTGATRVNASGFIETVGNDTPRFDYDPVTLQPRGLLIEEARTNLVTYSDQFNNAAWTKNNLNITVNSSTSPDGTTNADTAVTAVGTAITGGSSSGFTFTAASYTQSAYVKAATNIRYIQLLWTSGGISVNHANFDLQTGTVVGGSYASATMTAVGNGWYRITMTSTVGAATGGMWLIAVPSAASARAATYVGNGTDSFLVWGLQLELGAFATSYIPTVASTVTRNADVATMTGTNFSSWYNQSEGTFVGEASFFGLGKSTSDGLLDASNGTANETIAMFRTGSANNIASAIRDGGVDQATYVVALGSQPVKVATAYATNNTNFAQNGLAQTTDTACTMPTPDRLLIGSIYSAGNLPTNGHIRTIAYFNTRLPNAQLQTLTAPSLATTLSLDFTSGSYNVGF
jgi:hypothetical protein